MRVKLPKSRIDPGALRRSLGMNQQQFWASAGITQSGGSRYESGRRIPQPVALLLDIIYVKGIDLQQLEARDMAILAHLKTQHPDLYASLDKAAGGKPRGTSGGAKR